MKKAIEYIWMKTTGLFYIRFIKPQMAIFTYVLPVESERCSYSDPVFLIWRIWRILFHI